MTVVHVCVKGHSTQYEVYSKRRFDETAEVAKTKWKCPTCKEGLLAQSFIDDAPINKRN